MLHQLAARLGVTNVHFAGHVSNAELSAYYDVADLFLCASAHEGFCVPIVESFYKQIPVACLCRKRGAGDDGRRRRALYDAGASRGRRADRRRSRRRAAVASASCAKQDEALGRLRAKDFDGTLLRFVEQVLKSPRKPAPPVAWDFWDQVRLAEELFELQQYRPAIFRGLPESPESKTGLVEEKR